MGDGRPIVLLHGLTATRRYVVHGSKVLVRRGYRQVSFDARGHGASDPAAEDEGYSYPEMLDDLDAVLDEVGERCVVLAGDSMGAHTAVAYALARADRLAGLVVIRPVFTASLAEESLTSWDRLAHGLERGGIDGFMAAFDRGLDPAWRDTVVRFTRQRMLEHLHPEAVARALREVPRSAPFDTLAELEFCDVPALVVASNDDADPKHPYAVAAAYAERLPDSRLISEAEGEPPLAWRGGKLSHEIASFCAEPSVVSRFG
jgi:3-oxoadipate enol-lactonase